jgi:hypothetical protein
MPPPGQQPRPPWGGGFLRRLVAGLDHGQRVIERRELGLDGGQAAPHLLAFIGELISLFFVLLRELHSVTGRGQYVFLSLRRGSRPMSETP